MKAISKIITILICGFTAISLLLFFAVGPAVSDVGKLHIAVKAGKTELLAIQQQILAFKTAQSDLSKASRKDEIGQAISTRETLVDAVKDMELALAKVSGEHDLQINDAVNPKLAASAGVTTGRVGVDEIAYSLNVTTDYPGILTFLAFLEHLPHFTEISKINLSAETAEVNNQKAVHTGRVLGNFNGVFFVKSAQ